MNYYLINGELYSIDELRHHGIKGQKWGVRRYQNKDGSLTAAGKSRLKDSTRYGNSAAVAKPSSTRDHSQSDKSPLAFYLTNVALDLIMLNPIGAVQDIGRGAQACVSAIKSKMYDKDREACETDKKTGLLLKKRNMTAKEDLARVNPNVYNFDNNTKNNCMLCTAAYDLRRRGYEVKARKASSGYMTEEVLAWYPKVKINKITGLNDKGRPSTKVMTEKVKSELTKQGEGARGNLMIRWMGTMSGHSVAYEVSGGKLRIVDAQINKVYENPDIFLRRCANEISYARLDNVAFDPKTIREVAE